MNLLLGSNSSSTKCRRTTSAAKIPAPASASRPSERGDRPADTSDFGRETSVRDM